MESVDASPRSQAPARGGAAAAVAARPSAWVLAVVGGLALALGCLVYLADRPASHALLMPSLAGGGGRHWFGAIGLSLPTFVHCFAFSLFTAAAMKPGAASRWIACASWCTANVAFEIGQHAAFKPQWADALRTGAGDWIVTRSLLDYFLRGTFDVDDILAACLGAVCAAFVLQFVDDEPETRHATG